MSEQTFIILYHKYVAESLTPEEWREWKGMFGDESYANLFKQLVSETVQKDFTVAASELGDPQAIFKAITENNKEKERSSPALLMRMPASWMKYAAVFLVVLTGVGYYILQERSDSTSVTQINNIFKDSLSTDSKNRPVLILADGTTINLDSAAQGPLTTESGIVINKTANGAISYSVSSSYVGPPPMNTVQTPKGRQYQIGLPDGSRVWLNAYTSIRFPAAFPGDSRVVEIKGEAYFEVAPDKNRPFIVNLGSERTVEVLGTAFNVNNYADEPFYTTTLLEGSVKVKSQRNAVVLKKNQTVNISESCKLDPNINPYQQIAWKTGIFNLHGTDTKALLRQISRWYDVEILYDSNVPVKIFEGKLGRDLSLTQIRKVLSDFGIYNTLQGNKLIIK
jgi:transmembrane sensor